MRILFIIPPLLNSFVKKRKPSEFSSVGNFMVYRERNIDLGVGYLAAILEKEGYKIKIIDCDIEKISPKGLTNRIRFEKPDVVCISGVTENRFESFFIADLVKNVYPEISVIYGGIHATFTAEDTLKNVNSIDMIVRGEGELTIKEWIRAIKSSSPLNQIKGVSFRKDGNIIHNENRSWIKNLDKLPPPAIHLFPLEKYKRDFLEKSVDVPKVTPFLTRTDKTILHMLTSRGCPHGCVFCSNSAMWGNTRFRSAGNVLDEIESIIDKYHINNFSFVDDTFTLNKKHILELLDGIIARKLDITWRCNIRADTVNKLLLEKMKKAGCKYVTFGVESGSQKVLKHIGKNITIKQVKDLTKNLRKLDFTSRAFFMFGLPNETFDDALETIKLVFELKPLLSDIWISFATLIFPGTPLENFAKTKNYIPQNFSWSKPYKNNVDLRGYETNTPILLQPCMGNTELMKIQRILINKNLIQICSKT